MLRFLAALNRRLRGDRPPCARKLARVRKRQTLALEQLEDRLTPSGVVAAYSVLDNWGSGFEAQISLTNHQTVSVTNWKLSFTLPASITDIWDGTIASHTGNTYVVDNAGWNSTLAANRAVSFGFNATPITANPQPSNYLLNGQRLTAALPSLAITGATAAEPTSGTASAVFTVAVSAASTTPVTVKYATANGTALAGTDYSAVSGTLTFAPGQTKQTISIPVLADTKATGQLTFSLTLSSPSGATLGQSRATGTLTAAPTNKPAWPAHVFAPYIDMTLYPTPNLSTVSAASGVKFFTLAFITADTSNSDAPSWGGYSSYDVNGGAFDLQIRSEIAALRALGGDVSVSFGGAAGQELAQVITNVNQLATAYQTVINSYQLTHIDFDIEGAAVADTASIDRRSQAIALLQQEAAAAGRTLDVSFTLPALPTGLTSPGLYVLQSALKYGVKISLVNVMAMDYGDSAAPNPAGQMGTYAIDAANSLDTQLQGLYGTSLSSAQLWEMVGVTPMIGRNDVSDEVFDQAAATQLLAFAQQKGIGAISMWSLARDQQDPAGALSYATDDSSSIVQTPYQFSGIFEAFDS
jgi:hypothetical protein